MSDTIFGKPQGKWIVGSIAPRGAETALSGKWIGEFPVVSYPALSVRVPERLSLPVHPIILMLALKFLYSRLRK